ncbi:MAG: VCBS repeat-containing protein [Clostridiales bacterium]|nr:VCBS repeat-containing protein [Clostridiales bacterium]
MNRKRMLSIPAAVLAALLLLSGCYSVVADELYTLPRASSEYLKLQERIDEVLAAGAEYSPPTGGEQRQSMHLTDIDGDGVNEAVVFFTARSEDNPLKIYIFRSVGDDYEVADIIEGMGTGIESIRYVDMDGDGTLELVVGWQISSALKSASLYSLRSFQNIKIAQADYSALTIFDITGDGLSDLAVARITTAESPGALEVFSLMPDGEVVLSTAHMSEGIESVSKLVTGNLGDGTPAVFLDGKVAEGMITDVFCQSGGVLRNIARADSGDIAAPRALSAFSSDINSDGATEVPFTNPLPRQSDTPYYSIDWCSYSISGKRRIVMSTYHNYSESWYITLPDAWRDYLTVRREDIVRGERTLVFSLLDPVSEEMADVLRIYTLSGDNRFERARLSDRFTLLEEGETIYAAALYEPGAGFPDVPDREEIAAGFSLIHSDWLTGS